MIFINSFFVYKKGGKNETRKQLSATFNATTSANNSEDISKTLNENPQPKAKLLGKIPMRRTEELSVNAKFAPENWNEQEENKIPAVDTKSKEIDNSIFSDEARAKAREFIQGSEGYREEAYQDIAGIWTIGYGHTKNVKPGDKVTREEAEKLYKKDFEEHIAPLKGIKTPLTENQKRALASFIYNFGPNAFNGSDLRKKIEMGDIEGAANEFDRWIYAKNKNTGIREVKQGLVNRRKREKELFLKPDEEL